MCASVRVRISIPVAAEIKLWKTLGFRHKKETSCVAPRSIPEQGRESFVDIVGSRAVPGLQGNLPLLLL